MFDLGLILAAGKGVRAYPKSSYVPKPLLQVAGKELIVRNVEILPPSTYNRKDPEHPIPALGLTHPGIKARTARRGGADVGRFPQHDLAVAAGSRADCRTPATRI